MKAFDRLQIVRESQLSLETTKSLTRRVGYPPVAGHDPVLVHSIGQISAMPKRQDSERRSLIISRVTEPGYSGGPVISRRGYVVGIVEQENELVRKDGGHSIFVSASFAFYLREVP